ncbi:MAG: hypothetical protein K2O28_01515 [Clostridia bacterium]|nr:hypothetical protein [Clostridia bacterium]
MKSTSILLDRDDMSDFERGLFLKDMQRVNEEYFECEGNPSLEVTRTDDGFLVCVIFSARRIKSLKHPI